MTPRRAATAIKGSDKLGEGISRSAAILGRFGLDHNQYAMSARRNRRRHRHCQLVGRIDDPRFFNRNHGADIIITIDDDKKHHPGSCRIRGRDHPSFEWPDAHSGLSKICCKRAPSSGENFTVQFSSTSPTSIKSRRCIRSLSRKEVSFMVTSAGRLMRRNSPVSSA